MTSHDTATAGALNAGALNRDAIAGLIAGTPPLLADCPDPERQLQPNGFDLTVRSVAVLNTPAGMGSLGVSDDDRRLPEPPDHEPEADGWWTLPPGAYRITFNEVVNLPRWLMALARPRSSLLRMGVALHTAVWDAGYSGRFPSPAHGSPPRWLSSATQCEGSPTGIFSVGGSRCPRLHGTLSEREPVTTVDEITPDPGALRRLVDRAASDAGFDLVAVAAADEFAAERDAAFRRIDDGLMDGLPWFTKERVQRGARPQELLPGARSVISLGWNYCPSEEPAVPPGHGLVARYARGRDYHRVMKRRMRRVVLELSDRLGSRFAARWYVDDGPMLDRAAAARAGLGWFGKNGNILNPDYGSWLLLGQIITDLPLAPDQPLRKTCGQCVRCMPACPTDAIVAPYVVDNRRCISYLTIEHKGAIPLELRPAVGNWVFGCDICQEVCPVNRKAKATGDANFGRRDLDAVDLVELLEMTEADFRQRFAGTPLMRAKWEGMQRNACVALGNLDTPSASAIFRARPRPAQCSAPGTPTRRLGLGAASEARMPSRRCAPLWQLNRTTLYCLKSGRPWPTLRPSRCRSAALGAGRGGGWPAGFGNLFVTSLRRRRYRTAHPRLARAGVGSGVVIGTGGSDSIGSSFRVRAGRSVARLAVRRRLSRCAFTRSSSAANSASMCFRACSRPSRSFSISLSSRKKSLLDSRCRFPWNAIYQSSGAHLRTYSSR